MWALKHGEENGEFKLGQLLGGNASDWNTSNRTGTIDTEVEHGGCRSGAKWNGDEDIF